MNKVRKNHKGITLIALVVTIVVLLILAGVTINAILGDDGIIAQAKKASDAVNEAVINDEENIKNITGELNNIINNDRIEGDPTKSDEPKTVKEAVTSKTTFSKTTEITDGKDTMWVPEKFTVTEGDKIDDGVVVQDPDKNEFVWVPVKKINDMVYCYDHPNSIVSYNEAEDKLECEQCKTQNKETTNFSGKLYSSTIGMGNYFDQNTEQAGYNTNNSSYAGIREPDVVPEYNGKQYDADDNNLKIVLENYNEGNNADTLKKELQEEFNKMVGSIGKYKGFYIGRYETSGLSNNGETYRTISQGTVLKNQTSINNATWYRQYVSNKKIGSNYKDVATTSMIWGCQWDQVMLWMKNVDNTQKTGVKYIKDSTGMGNYDETKKGDNKIIPTGSNDNYAVKKIYDMAGNVIDYTIESYISPDRVNRGGYYGNAGYEFPASSRNSWVLDEDDGTRGSRSMLYINKVR